MKTLIVLVSALVILGSQERANASASYAKFECTITQMTLARTGQAYVPGFEGKKVRDKVGLHVPMNLPGRFADYVEFFEIGNSTNPGLNDKYLVNQVNPTEYLGSTISLKFTPLFPSLSRGQSVQAKVQFAGFTGEAYLNCTKY